MAYDLSRINSVGSIQVISLVWLKPSLCSSCQSCRHRKGLWAMFIFLSDQGFLATEKEKKKEERKLLSGYVLHLCPSWTQVSNSFWKHSDIHGCTLPLIIMAILSMFSTSCLYCATLVSHLNVFMINVILFLCTVLWS